MLHLFSTECAVFFNQYFDLLNVIGEIQLLDCMQHEETNQHWRKGRSTGQPQTTFVQDLCMLKRRKCHKTSFNLPGRKVTTGTLCNSLSITQFEILTLDYSGDVIEYEIHWVKDQKERRTRKFRRKVCLSKPYQDYWLRPAIFPTITAPSHKVIDTLYVHLLGSVSLYGTASVELTICQPPLFNIAFRPGSRL